MNQQKPHDALLALRRILLLFLLASAGYHAAAQGGNDSIYYNSTCRNSSITFNSSVFDNAPHPNKISWNFGDPSAGIYNTAAVQQPTHIYASTGTYYVSLFVINNFIDTIRVMDTINIVDPLPFSFGPDAFLCQGQDTTVIAPALAGATYLWNDDSATTTQSLPVTQTGVYTVSINGCAVTDSIGIFFSARPRINLGQDHVLCEGENLVLNASTQNGQYTWFLNGSQLAQQEGQLPVTDPGGTYSVQVNVPGCGLYGDTVSITFSQPPAPFFSLGPDSLLCPKQVLPLKARAAGATAYLWSNGSKDSMIYISNAGNYWAFVTIGNQCEVVDSVLISYRGDRKLDFNDTAICKGTTLLLDANFGVGKYNWQSIPPQRDDQGQTDQSTYLVYRPGTYSITAAVGQCLYSDTLTVTFNDSLRVILTRDTTLCYGETFFLQVSGNANTYTWQDSTSSTSYPAAAAGTYTVVARNGCNSDTLQSKVAFQACPCNLLLPNAFTPNADGRNDTFRPLHACNMTAYTIRIYNRFGEMVFQSNDPNQAWDGVFKGSKSPAGTYVWTVGYTNTDTKKAFFKKGWVVLLR